MCIVCVSVRMRVVSGALIVCVLGETITSALSYDNLQYPIQKSQTPLQILEEDIGYDSYRNERKECLKAVKVTNNGIVSVTLFIINCISCLLLGLHVY